MGDVKLNSSGGGSVTLTPPNTASNYTVTLPAATSTLVDTTSTQTLTNKTLTAAGSNTVEATSGPTSTQLAGQRNKIINGAMMIDQRNAGAAITPAATQYTLDRWGVELTLASKLTFQQVTDAPTGFSKSLKITVASSAAVATGDANNIYHMIEGYNIADLMWGTASAASISISFWVKSSVTGTYSWFIRNAGDARNYVGTFAINSANTWEQKIVSISGDTSGTWDSGNGRGIMLGFALGDGATFETSGGAWAAGAKMQVTGTVDFISQSNGATFYITGVQLEKGATATPFENRLYGTELALCQRYYQTILEVIGSGTASGATTIGWQFGVAMRATPTVTYVVPTGFGALTGGPYPSPTSCSFVGTSSAGNQFSVQPKASAEL